MGTITATGGGTVRDLLLGNTPVFWMHETEYLWICLLTSLGVFFLWSYLAKIGEPCITLLVRGNNNNSRDNTANLFYCFFILLCLSSDHVQYGRTALAFWGQISSFRENSEKITRLSLEFE